MSVLQFNLLLWLFFLHLGCVALIWVCLTKTVVSQSRTRNSALFSCLPLSCTKFLSLDMLLLVRSFEEKGLFWVAFVAVWYLSSNLAPETGSSSWCLWLFSAFSCPVCCLATIFGDENSLRWYSSASGKLFLNSSSINATRHCLFFTV